MVKAAVLALLSTLAAAKPWGSSNGGFTPNYGRPSYLPAFHPHPPPQPFNYTVQPRFRECVLRARGNGQDDSADILEALHLCNNGGVVVFPSDQSFTIGTALNITFLNHIDLDIQGNITFTNDTNYWQANGFHFTFQNVTTFFNLGGNDVNIYGGGVLNGNGQVWYDLYPTNSSTLRPVLMGINGLNGGTIGPLTLLNSPEYFFFVQNTSNVVITNIDASAVSTSKNLAANTDGIDTYRSNNIVIQNWNVNNADDCVSFKPNSTNMLVQNMICNGSHGISVGSLGQYPGEVDIVENIYVYNISMSNAQNGARIKVWPSVPSTLSADLQGGGGKGMVRNITYDTFGNTNVDYAITLTGCYGQNNFTLCQLAPSAITMQDVLFKNVFGTTSKKYNPVSGTLICSSNSTCTDIVAEDINLVDPSGLKNNFQCGDLPTASLAVNCTLPP